jgi:hypothetical protein
MQVDVSLSVRVARLDGLTAQHIASSQTRRVEAQFHRQSQIGIQLAIVIHKTTTSKRVQWSKCPTSKSKRLVKKLLYCSVSVNLVRKLNNNTKEELRESGSKPA